MMTLWEIMSWVSQKERFRSIQDYIDFARCYLGFISQGLQAKIVARNETNYQFFQYKRDGEYNITRPVNMDLFLTLQAYEGASRTFEETLADIRRIRGDQAERELVDRFIYTTQQSIGCALDALPSSKTNASRKLNGDLFEDLIRLVIGQLGLTVSSGVSRVRIPGSDEVMLFQNDIEIKISGRTVAIGSVKTSSKDRIDKVFLDRMMYDRLTGTDIPHFAVFLHDVQRAGREPDYRVGQTFLTGHFKAYTIGLDPLDGVYYCDLRPVMKTDEILREQIKPLDHLLCEDIWDLLS